MDDTNRQSASDAAETSAQVGVELAVAVSRLRARMRTEAGEPGRGITVSQVAMMRRLVECGPMTASQLASTEHVSQQAIAQRLDLFKPTGYLALAPDPDDRRRKLVSITDKGREFLDELSAGDREWLTRAIDAVISEDELPALAAAIGLLDRIASADLENRGLLR